MAARKTRSDSSNKKRTPEFVGEIQTMVDNDRSKSVWSIANNLGKSEFLINQVVHKDIQYFSYKMRKSQFLS